VFEVNAIQLRGGGRRDSPWSHLKKMLNSGRHLGMVLNKIMGYPVRWLSESVGYVRL